MIELPHFVIDGTKAPKHHLDRWDPGRYELAVAYIIRTLVGGFEVSRALEQHLRHKALVHPCAPHPHAIAWASADSADDATPQGEYQRSSRDHEWTPWDDTGLPSRDNPTGTGLGSAGRIAFTPSDSQRPNAPIPRTGGAPQYADAVFVHELVHVVRFSHGVFTQLRFDPDRRRSWGMENTEEYYAWMIEGMYCSQRGIPVRRSYHDWSRQRFEDNPRGRGNPYVGLQHYWVERFFREIPTLARALASIPEPRCQFNPFRDYVTGDYRRSSTIRPVYSAAHPIAARPPPGPPIPSSDIFD
ncbi:MAG: hypothetical protein H6719_21960 [Sandaracinaceae bacterium]|nr:hypothetical protein [Sandaracinaceae bacterium]